MPRTEEFNRDEAIAKAKQVFWAKGYNGTSMQDLVDATSLNRSSIYNSFGSKMDLYRLTLEQYKLESQQLFEEVKAADKNGLESIGVVFLYAMKNIFSDTENKGCLLINCNTEMGNQCDYLNGFLEKNYQKLHEHFLELVIEGQQDGSINKHQDPSSMAHYITCAFQGFRITGLNNKDPKVLKGIIQNILKTLT